VNGLSFLSAIYFPTFSTRSSGAFDIATIIIGGAAELALQTVAGAVDIRANAKVRERSSLFILLAFRNFWFQIAVNKPVNIGIL
jgi:hypothetical protein